MAVAEEFLTPYNPPSWACHLKDAPSQKVSLANLPTPIHRWYLPGLPEGVEVYIKRDDMTGCALTGNKVRKLEFLLAAAIQENSKHVVTCGGVQSNHCRATAVAAAQLGLKCHLMLKSDIQDAKDLSSVGNTLLDQLSGANIYNVPKKSLLNSDLIPRMDALAESIRKRTGEKCYKIPTGGSDNVGVWGYINAFSELQGQGVAERFDDIAFACGSGGTAEGLALGNYLTKSSLGIHGLVVSAYKQYYKEHLENVLLNFGMEGEVKLADIFDTVEGPIGLGYGLSTDEELEFIMEVSQKTGIFLDPVYTGKAVLGLVKELKSNPSRFHGNRILYIHTGGVFGMFDGRLEDKVKNDVLSQNNIHLWPSGSDQCPL